MKGKLFQPELSGLLAVFLRRFLNECVYRTNWVDETACCMNDSHITGIWSCVTLVNGLLKVDWTSIVNPSSGECFLDFQRSSYH